MPGEQPSDNDRRQESAVEREEVAYDVAPELVE
jgi:hypothetical protein